MTSPVAPVRTRALAMSVAVLGAALASCGEKPGDGPSEAPGDRAGTRPSAEPLPRIDLAGLERLKREATEADRILVLDFWATWCVPCVEMFPRLHGELKGLEGVEIVSVTLDTPGEAEAKAIRFLRKHDARAGAYMLAPDVEKRLAVPESLGRAWSDLVVPAVLVYDRSGNLAGERLEGGAGPIIERVKELLHGSATEPSGDG